MILRLCLILALIGFGGRVAAQDLRVDLSEHLITLTAGFTGEDVVLFGSRLGGGEVAVIVRGPVKPIAVRRTDRVMGVWLNAASARFDAAPSFYAVASSAPLDEIATPATRAVHQIGIENLRVVGPGPNPPGEAFQDALIRLKTEAGLYRAEPKKITSLGPALFRVTFDFPDDVPTGQYLVEALLLRDGQVAAAQTTPLVVEKSGAGAAVSAFARDRAPIYALIAVVAAAAAGWLVDRAFRRG